MVRALKADKSPASGHPSPAEHASSGRPRGRPSSRERILEAASELAHEVGAGNLSLDAVAERAGISKGGLLYNFPTKIELLRALVVRHVERMEAQTLHALQERGGGANALIHAVLQASCVVEPDTQRPKPTGILAAIAEDPQLIDPIRDYHRRLIRRLREASPQPERAFVAFLVLEGLHAQNLFEIGALTEADQERVIAFLRDFLDAETPTAEE
jgi:AcrR family transcriptional regulator